MSGFVDAQAGQFYLRLGMEGGPGSGKTWSSLAIMSELRDIYKRHGLSVRNGKIAVIDTENASALRYKRHFDFDHLNLRDHSPESFAKWISHAASENYFGLIIDSFSHEWAGRGGVLEKHGDAVNAQSKKNSYVAWAGPSKQHNAVIETIVGLNIHVIACMRAKVKHILKDGQIKEIGYKAIQRKETPYEFDVMMKLDMDNRITFGKSRCVSLARKVFDPNREDTRAVAAQIAGTLAEWMTEGGAEVEAVPAVGTISVARRDQLKAMCVAAGESPEDVRNWLHKNGFAKLADLTDQAADRLEHVLTHKLRNRVQNEQAHEEVSVKTESLPTASSNPVPADAVELSDDQETPRVSPAILGLIRTEAAYVGHQEVDIWKSAVELFGQEENFGSVESMDESEGMQLLGHYRGLADQKRKAQHAAAIENKPEQAPSGVPETWKENNPTGEASGLPGKATACQAETALALFLMLTAPPEAIKVAVKKRNPNYEVLADLTSDEIGAMIGALEANCKKKGLDPGSTIEEIRLKHEAASAPDAEAEPTADALDDAANFLKRKEPKREKAATDGDVESAADHILNNIQSAPAEPPFEPKPRKKTKAELAAGLKAQMQEEEVAPEPATPKKGKRTK